MYTINESECVIPRVDLTLRGHSGEEERLKPLTTEILSIHPVFTDDDGDLQTCPEKSSIQLTSSGPPTPSMQWQFCFAKSRSRCSLLRTIRKI